MDPKHQVSNSYEPVQTGLNQAHPLRKAGWWSRISPYYILIPSVVSALLLYLDIKNYKNADNLYIWIRNYRTITQVIVHLLSTLLAFLWVYPICTVINHWGRYQLLRQHTPFKKLKLWSAMSSKRINLSLPWMFLLASVGFLALTYLPATIWVGALTPVLTTRTSNSTLTSEY